MIHQLKQDGHSISEIARRLNMDRKTVRKKLSQGLEPPSYKARPVVASVLDKFKPYLRERLEDYPGLSATRLLRDITDMGYTGSYTTLTEYLRTIRAPKSNQFERRFETAPGHQAQVDFARFTTRFRSEPDVERVVWLFLMVLGFSRYMVGQFAWRQTLDTVVRCHIESFKELSGVPQQCLYDRMKTAVLGEPEPGNVVYHPTLMGMGSHYGFVPKSCKPYRAKTKGKVERPFRYVRQDFFLSESFEDIHDLNSQFTAWRSDIANVRKHGTTQRIIQDAFLEEQASLGALPAGDFNDVLSMERRTTKDGMVSVDGNLYSVPNGTGRKPLQIERTATQLRILDGQILLAVHPLLLGKNQRQVIQGHRASSPSVTPVALGSANDTVIERAGDSVAQRALDEYEIIGNTLAKEVSL